ncbi:MULTISPECIES: DUF2164 domain-containing protein [Bacillaceae]|uniref:DUF2164 domain-containing protein n=1 Tax=Evansella alkalicola TaxID=745819 RepID=A0ABS6JV33_9BACI|nr:MULTISPECIES: DUF2164 domain-containing protein [Bacillaceae]MBU9722404.1 DUF2164 domain-containing protein [Bacillus alkalicola]
MFIRFSKENKAQMMEQVKEYFYNERSEEIGDLAAENFIEYFTKEFGPYYYNEGVKDAKGVCQERMANLEEDILSLERPTINRR